MSKPSGSSNKVRTTSLPQNRDLAGNTNSASGLMNWAPIIFLGVIAIIFLQARLQLLAIPLERDEGSFAYIGHWLLHGKRLYTDLLDSKLPGLYALYSLFTTVFRYNASGIHLGLLFSNVISGVLFFYFLNDLFNRHVAAISTSFFLILVLSPNVVGFAAHATQLLMPFLFAGCWLFWKGVRAKKIWIFFFAGLMIGIAFTIKQQAAVFGILLAIIWWPIRLAWDKKENSWVPILEWIFLGVGGLLPLALTIGYFAITSRFDQFIFWTFEQPAKLSQSIATPGYKLLWEGMMNVISGFEFIWIAGGIGLLFIFLLGFEKEKKIFGFLFAIIGMISIAIGVGYYVHYFVLALPGIAMGVGITSHWISKKTGRFGPMISLAVVLILMLIPLAAKSDYYFHPDYATIHQQAYHQNMFPELEKIGKEIAKRTPEGSHIAVLGSEPEVLVAANREGCSKYLMVYSLFIDPVNSPKMQDEYFNEMTACGADYVVFDVFSSSWTNDFEETAIYKRNADWLKAQFVLDGVAEFRDGQPGLISWDENVRNYSPKSTYIIYVFKRK